MKKIFSFIVIVLITLLVLTHCTSWATHQLSQGMSKNQVIDAIGEPFRVTVCGEYEFWQYDKSNYKTVKFDHGRVASFVNPQREVEREELIQAMPDYKAIFSTIS